MMTGKPTSSGSFTTVTRATELVTVPSTNVHSHSRARLWGMCSGTTSSCSTAIATVANRLPGIRRTSDVTMTAVIHSTVRSTEAKRSVRRVLSVAGASVKTGS